MMHTEQASGVFIEQTHGTNSVDSRVEWQQLSIFALLQQFTFASQ